MERGKGETRCTIEQCQDDIVRPNRRIPFHVERNCCVHVFVEPLVFRILFVFINDTIRQ